MNERPSIEALQEIRRIAANGITSDDRKRGKELQRRFGDAVIPMKLELEDAAGKYARLREVIGAPYTQLEIEHCIEAENRWGETFVEAVHDPERATLSDVKGQFWGIYGRRHDGKADWLCDTDNHDKAFEIAWVLSSVAFNSIFIVDRSPEGLNNG